MRDGALLVHLLVGRQDEPHGPTSTQTLNGIPLGQGSVFHVLTEDRDDTGLGQSINLHEVTGTLDVLRVHDHSGL